MMSKNSIVPFLKDYLIKFLTRPFLLDTNGVYIKTNLLKKRQNAVINTKKALIIDSFLCLVEATCMGKIKNSIFVY